MTDTNEKPGSQEAGSAGTIDLGGGHFRRVGVATRTVIDANLLDGGVKYRAPLSVAILSYVFQEYAGEFNYTNILPLSVYFICSALCAFRNTSRAAVLVFAVTAFYFTAIPNWFAMANHTWLALWTITVAMIFKDWWQSELYAFYLRITFALVMFAACAQKIVAGTYLDGSYIYWLSLTGSTTEQMFSFACDMDAGSACIHHKIMGVFIMVWQFAVGFLLLIGVKSLIFLTVEIGFLLSAGIYADEMNFQVLNIALLCIVFRVGMPVYLLITLVFFLILDIFGIGDTYLFILGLFS